ncbi:MAG: hypothetical protein AB4063_18995 [Crocosphaera sp.]
MNGNFIDPFMWEDQENFQSSINSTAKELFDKIDPDLQPEVFLLGVLMDERDDKHHIYLEPRDCGYKVSDFSSLKKLAIELENVDEERYILFLSADTEVTQISQSNHNKRLKVKAYKELKEPNQWIDVIDRDSEELIRQAGKIFMYTVAYVGRNYKRFAFYGLYEALNTISSLKYEGEEGLGKMAIARKNHPNIKYTLQLKEPINPFKIKSKYYSTNYFY